MIVWVKRMAAVLLAAVLTAAAAPCVWAESQYVNNDRVYERRNDVTVYISDDSFLYHFSGQVAGVTVCGYTGRQRELVIPEEINGRAVAAIDENTLADNKRITSVVIPPAIVAIGAGSFNNCPNLEKVTLSGDVQVLENVFCGCPRLESVSFPYGVTEINHSFADCTGLRKVTFSRSVTRLGDGSFNGCGAVSEIGWSTGLSYLGDVFDGNLMLSTIHIPKGIVVINGAFDNCTFAEVLELPDSLLYINSGFNGCTALRQVHFPDGLVYVGSAFQGCRQLSDVRLPPSAVVDESAFVDCPHVNLQPRHNWRLIVLAVAGVLLAAVSVGWLMFYRRRTQKSSD